MFKLALVFISPVLCSTSALLMSLLSGRVLAMPSALAVLENYYGSGDQCFRAPPVMFQQRPEFQPTPSPCYPVSIFGNR
jgi:hypothetical protein